MTTKLGTYEPVESRRSTEAPNGADFPISEHLLEARVGLRCRWQAAGHGADSKAPSDPSPLTLSPKPTQWQSPTHWQVHSGLHWPMAVF